MNNIRLPSPPPNKWQLRPQHLLNRLSFDNALLLLIPTNPVIRVAKLLTAHLFQKIFVVRDDDDLKIGLLTTLLDDAVERVGQRADIIRVQVGRRFVESDNLRVFVSHGNS